MNETKINPNQILGGGVPTLTWYTGQTGNTITIPNTTGASFVKVFKNGLLLRQGVAKTNYKFTGGEGKWVSLTNTYQLNTADSWYYEGRFTLTSSRSNRGTNGEFFGFVGQTDSQAPLFGLRTGTSDDLRLALSSNGSTWNMGVINISYILNNYGEIYDIKMGYEGGTYYIDIKKAIERAYTRIYAMNSSLKAYAGAPIQLLNSQEGIYGQDWNGSTLWMQHFKVVVDDAIQFDGSTATLGIDYTNNGCTQESVETCTNDYCVSGTTLTLAEDLFGTDEIAVEIY